MKIIKIAMALGIAGIFLSGNSAPVEIDCNSPVVTKSGLVAGKKEDNADVCVWKGIPFAAPPVGELRWRAPQPMPKWEGVREAKEFGHRCMQKGIFKLEVATSKEGMSEDCLYLNVWRPKSQEGLRPIPVMFWIHGGGYTGGSANTPMYWGDRLAEQGNVVVVSTNYRLNVFGFFSSPALAEEDHNKSVGNYAILDLIAALKWVHDNISNFGGDPNNVTIFGESAGGFAVCTLLATPLGKGLFHKAILESGGCTASESLEQGYEHGKEIARNLGCDEKDLKCLRAIPAKTLLEKGSGGMMQRGSVPHHDGYVLKDTPLSMIEAGNYNRVPFMAGSCRDEFGNTLRLMKRFKKIQPENYEQGLIDEFNVPPEDAKKLVQLYPLSEFHNRPVEAYGRMFGADASLGCPTYLGLLAVSKQQQDTYHYRFDYDEMALGKYFGAAHSFEIPFIFDAFDRMPMNLLYTRKNTAQAKALGKIIQAYWVNFAKTGNPNGEGLPFWSPFRADSQQTQILDREIKTEAGTFKERCEFLNDYTTKHKLDMDIIRSKKN